MAVAAVSGVAVAAAIATQPALAGTPVFALGDYQTIDYGPNATFTFSTHTPYWSAVLVMMTTGGADMKQKPDFNLRVTRTDTSTAVSSKFGIMETDFVAIDSNRPECANKSYQADVTFNAGSTEGAYTAMLLQGSNSLSTRTLPLSSADLVPNTMGSGPGRYLNVIRDVYLVAGRKVEVWGLNSKPSETSRVWVMASSASGCMINRASRVASGDLPTGSTQGKVLTFTPTYTGWYGILNLGSCCKSDGTYDSLTVGQASS